MEALTPADLTELGFSYNDKVKEWQKVGEDGVADVMAGLNHADSPRVYVGDTTESYAPRFFGVRTRANLEALIRLIGTQPK